MRGRYAGVSISIYGAILPGAVLEGMEVPACLLVAAGATCRGCYG